MVLKNILKKVLGINNSFNKPNSFEQACDYTTTHKTSCKVEYVDNKMKITLNDGTLSDLENTFICDRKISVEEFFSQVKYLQQNGSTIMFGNDELFSKYREFISK